MLATIFFHDIKMLVIEFNPKEFSRFLRSGLKIRQNCAKCGINLLM